MSFFLKFSANTIDLNNGVTSIQEYFIVCKGFESTVYNSSYITRFTAVLRMERIVLKKVKKNVN